VGTHLEVKTSTFTPNQRHILAGQAATIQLAAQTPKVIVAQASSGGAPPRIIVPASSVTLFNSNGTSSQTIEVKTEEKVENHKLISGVHMSGSPIIFQTAFTTLNNSPTTTYLTTEGGTIKRIIATGQPLPKTSPSQVENRVSLTPICTLVTTPAPEPIVTVSLSTSTMLAAAQREPEVDAASAVRVEVKPINEEVEEPETKKTRLETSGDAATEAN
jgi:hypothetical protein